MSAQPELVANTHVTLNLGAAGEVEGFYQFDMPSSTLQTPEQHVWDANGAPQKVTSTALVQWSPVSGSRYMIKDEANKLWEAYKKAIEDPNGAKEDYEINVLNKGGDPELTWSLKGAYVSAYSTSSQAAGGNEIASVTITITYDDAEPA